MGMRKYLPAEIVKKARAVIHDVSAETGIPSHLIYADDRRKVVVEARYEAIHRIHSTFPDLSTMEIGKLLERDHTTILYALEKLKKKPKFDSEKRKNRRKRFSEREVLKTLLLQGVIIPCGHPKCNDLITLKDVEEAQRDHTTPRALDGPDTPENCTYMHGRCHARKTNGAKHLPVDGDKHKIAKSKRLAKGGRKRKGRKIQSRGFQKNLKSEYNRETKRFETVRRT